LPSSIAALGSTKSVPALPDSSWTIPSGRLRESRRTGNDVSATPNRHRCVGGGRARLEPAQQRFQAADQPSPGLVHLAARRGQCRAGGIEHRAVGIERLLQPAFQRLVR
jgi:hypothetical protein